MAALAIYHIALVTHIIGLTILAGTTLVDYIITKQFWKQYAKDKSKGFIISELMSKFQVLPRIGGLLLIISGIGMMAITHGAFGEQIWFRIKFGLVIIIIINALALGRRQVMKLKKLLSQETSGENVDAKLLKVKTNINWFHISQITFFIIIFVLSVFKFN